MVTKRSNFLNKITNYLNFSIHKHLRDYLKKSGYPGVEIILIFAESQGLVILSDVILNPRLECRPQEKNRPGLLIAYTPAATLRITASLLPESIVNQNCRTLLD